MHCGMCHTPKNALGGDETARALQGYALQGWFAPDLTDPRRGLGAWSVEDIVTYLKTGHNRFAAATGPMAEEVELDMHNDRCRPPCGRDLAQGSANAEGDTQTGRAG